MERLTRQSIGSLLEKTTVSDWSIICLVRTVLMLFSGYGHRTFSMGSIGCTPYLMDRTLPGAYGRTRKMIERFFWYGGYGFSDSVQCALAGRLLRPSRADDDGMHPPNYLNGSS